MPKSKRHIARVLLCILTASIAINAAVLVWAYLDYRRPPGPKRSSLGPNALWARHQWVGSAHAEPEYRQFCDLLRRHRISDVFFHVGPLNSAGEIEAEKYRFAPELLRFLKQNCPLVRSQAWMGQIEARAGGPLHLDSAQTRARIVATADSLLRLGFDGIHYNIEPVYQGDENFLDLLRATAQVTRSRQKILSLASDELEPFWGTNRLLRLFFRRAGLWNEAYYRKVAAYADQIAVMMYDTAMPRDWLYGSLVKRQTRRLLDIVPEHVTLFIGIPTYEESSWGFHPEAENIVSGLRGIQKGIESHSPEQLKRFGAAIYAEWVTDVQEWNFFSQEWLQRQE